MKLKPLFRYVGGKSTVIRYYPETPTEINSYSEPFLGSAAMLCHLVNRHATLGELYLNDLDYNVYSVYKFIQNNNVSEILSEIRRLELNQRPNKQSYKLALADFNNNVRKHPLVFLWLLRNSFGGCFRYGKTDGKLIMGIGHVLKNQWDLGQLSAWHHLLQRAQVTNLDYKKVSLGNFTFVDPPYVDSNYSYQLGNKPGAANLLSQEVIDYYDQFNCTTWVSNKKSPQLDTKGFKVIELNVVYNLGRRASETITEILLVTP